MLPRITQARVALLVKNNFRNNGIATFPKFTIPHVGTAWRLNRLGDLAPDDTAEMMSALTDRNELLGLVWIGAVNELARSPHVIARTCDYVGPASIHAVAIVFHGRIFPELGGNTACCTQDEQTRFSIPADAIMAVAFWEIGTAMQSVPNRQMAWLETHVDNLN